MLRRQLLFRVSLILLALLALMDLNGLGLHFYSYLTGNIINTVIIQQWHVVAINIAIFMALLIPLSFRRKTNWLERGMVSAFFISLFIEMYGIPLTIILASGILMAPAGPVPGDVTAFSFLGVGFGVDFGMAYGLLYILLGISLIMTGWITLYRNREEGVVTTGIYSITRHPQNLGMILIAVGWFVAWPTFLTLAFFPVLVYRYVTLSRKEEAEFLKESPSYSDYKKQSPFLL